MSTRVPKLRYARVPLCCLNALLCLEATATAAAAILFGIQGDACFTAAIFSRPTAVAARQAPQLFRSKTTLVHTPLQQRSSGESQQVSPHGMAPPVGHWQNLSTQTCPAGQCLSLSQLPGLGLVRLTKLDSG